MPKKKDYSEDSKNFFFNEQNKKKVKKLKEKYGMIDYGSGEDAPPEIINIFLNNVEKFEQQYENAENKKVIEIMGFPKFKKLEELKPGSLEQEIDKVLGLYGKFNMYIDIIEEDDVSDEDFYKFIAEELPQHETNFMQIEGMNANFIYEEFHPSKKLDARDTINYFKYALLDKKEEDIKMWLSKGQLHINGEPKSLSQFIDEMYQSIPEKIVKCEINFKTFSFDAGDIVDADFVFEYEIVSEGKKRAKQKILNLKFDLVSSEFGGFEIKGCYTE